MQCAVPLVVYTNLSFVMVITPAIYPVLKALFALAVCITIPQEKACALTLGMLQTVPTSSMVGCAGANGSGRRATMERMLVAAASSEARRSAPPRASRAAAASAASAPPRSIVASPAC